MVTVLLVLKSLLALLIVYGLTRFLRRISKNYYIAKNLNLPGPEPVRPIVGNMRVVSFKDPGKLLMYYIDVHFVD